MNVFCFVGKISVLPELKEAASGQKVTDVSLSVERPFANADGNYEQDLIHVEVWRGLAQTICATARIGDWISVKGRVANRPYEREGRIYNSYTFVAEKIGFLSKENS